MFEQDDYIEYFFPYRSFENRHIDSSPSQANSARPTQASSQGSVLVLRYFSHQASPHIPPPTIATLKSFEDNDNDIVNFSRWERNKIGRLTVA